MQKNRFLMDVKHLLSGAVICFLLVGCVATNPSGKVIDKNKSLGLHIQMAKGYVAKGNRESARFHLQKAFAIDPNSAAATGEMAQLYLIEGEPVLAEEQFKLALKRDKNLTEVHNNYGIFLFNQKRYEDAYAEFEKAAADLAFSGRAQALTNVGRVALKLGNVVRAQAAFEHAAILDKNSPDAFIELADINFQKQSYAEAKKNLDIYTAIGQQSSRSLYLGIRLENIFGNKDGEASLVSQLKNKFPYSSEYLEYKQRQLN
jgi:type IV pilus assembly protein PilF